MSEGNPLSPIIDNSTVSYKHDVEECINFLNNKEKEKPLNIAVEMALIDIGADYIDLTPHNNFKNSTEHHEADFLIPQFNNVTENKNWDCYNHKGYTVTMYKAKTQILSRFLPYMHCKNKTLIIAKPKWDKGVKQWLMACGIKVIELGYQVDYTNFKQAYQYIKRQLLTSFGYLVYCIDYIVNSVGLIVNSLARSSRMIFDVVNGVCNSIFSKFRWKLRHLRLESMEITGVIKNMYKRKLNFKIGKDCVCEKCGKKFRSMVKTDLCHDCYQKLLAFIDSLSLENNRGEVKT